MRMSDCTPERARGGTRPTSEGRFPEEFAARQTIPTQRAIPRKSKNDYLMGFEPKTRGRQAGVLPVGHGAGGVAEITSGTKPQTNQGTGVERCTGMAV